MTTGASILDPAITAVATRLNGDATFLTLCPGKARDAVEQGSDLPYAWLTVRETPAPMETFGRMGQEIEIGLTVYDRDGNDGQEGTKRLDDVIARAVVLLHHQHAALTLAGWNLPLLHYLGSQALPLLEDTDGQLIRSKLARFRGLAEVAA